MFSLHTRARRSQASAYTRSALEGGHSGGDRSFVRERIERKNFGPSWAAKLENRCAGHLGNLARLSDARHRGVSKVLMNRIELDH